MDALKECPLFAGIEPSQWKALLPCLNAQRRSYAKDEYIFRVDEPALFVGVVLSGGAHVIQEDFWGNRAILTHVVPGDLFGEALSCAGTDRLPFSVVATEASDILLIDYRRISRVCSSACVFHARMIANMLHILADKNVRLTQKMEHISKRTTRDKLLSFLSAQAVQADSHDIAIQFSRQELADYLCVERSALSRELGAMKRDGLLDYTKNRFILKTLS